MCSNTQQNNSTISCSPMLLRCINKNHTTSTYNGIINYVSSQKQNKTKQNTEEVDVFQISIVYLFINSIIQSMYASWQSQYIHFFITV